MTDERFAKFLSHTVTSIFTFLVRDDEVTPKLYPYYYNSYSLYKESSDEDYVYHVFYNNFDSEKFILDYYGSIADITYTETYIIVKVEKSRYMSPAEWEQMKRSEYDKFSNLLYTLASRINGGKCLSFYIMSKNSVLRQYLERLIDTDIEETNIYWKRFQINKETLDLSKLTNMSDLIIKEQWLLDQIEKATVFDKEAYQNVLKNSVRVAVPLVTGLHATYSYKDLFKRLKDHLKAISGKSQVKVKFKPNPKEYNFMPTETEFLKKVKNVVAKYKITDMVKLEKCLINHINSYESPSHLLKYYIEKNNSSTLAEDYENFDETVEIVKPELKKRETLF